MSNNNIPPSKHRFTCFKTVVGLLSIFILSVTAAHGSAIDNDKATDRPANAAQSADVPADWWAQVQEDISRSEYHVTWQKRTSLANLPEAYQAPNRAHNLRTYFTDDGIRVIPRTGEAAWEWGLKLASYGRVGYLQSPIVTKPTANGNRIEYRRGDLTEWYVNDARGLEQGFTLHHPPPSQGENIGVQVDLRIAGNLHANLSNDGQQIEFLTRDSVRVLSYGQLEATDATSRKLPARFTLAGEHFSILVDDASAVYPITIDPLATSPNWTAEGDQDYAYFGLSVSTAGDVNGDGFSDIIISAPYYDNGQTDEGRAYVYHGSASGLSSIAAWTAEGDQDDAYFGNSVSTAGDVNSDGYSDGIVGAHYYDNGQTDEGRAYVYHGSAAGLSPTPTWTAESDQSGAFFGRSVSTAGDVNGDGYGDVIIGAPSYDNGQTNEGRAFVYHGSATGLNPTPAWIAESNQASAWFGWCVSTAGEVNGDG